MGFALSCNTAQSVIDMKPIKMWVILLWICLQYIVKTDSSKDDSRWKQNFFDRLQWLRQRKQICSIYEVFFFFFFDSLMFFVPLLDMTHMSVLNVYLQFVTTSAFSSLAWLLKSWGFPSPQNSDKVHEQFIKILQISHMCCSTLSA